MYKTLIVIDNKLQWPGFSTCRINNAFSAGLEVALKCRWTRYRMKWWWTMLKRVKCCYSSWKVRYCIGHKQNDVDFKIKKKQYIVVKLMNFRIVFFLFTSLPPIRRNSMLAKLLFFTSSEHLSWLKTLCVKSKHFIENTF